MKLPVAQIIDLNLIDYREALELQKRIVSDRIRGALEHDLILILEHPPVFTLGKRGGRENLIVSEEFLKSRGIYIIETERGGNITYHGPGQLVLYPIINIEQRRTGVSDFVCALEEVMIRTAADFGVTALRDERNHGVWVRDGQSGTTDKGKSFTAPGSSAKLGSIGLSVRRGISFHGLALNVNPDLTPFNWINPCGMAGLLMTSLENELRKSHQTTLMEPSIEIGRVKEKLLYHFQNITGVEL